MIQYLIKRFFLMIVTMLGIVIVTFAITRLAPGDPIATRAENVGRSADNQAMIDEAIRQRRMIYGLDKPMFFNFHFEERAWFVRDALRRATDPEEKENNRKIARRELQDLSSATYPDLVPLLAELPEDQLDAALEVLRGGARHTLPAGLARRPLTEQADYWRETWQAFIPGGPAAWERHAAEAVAAAMRRADAASIAEVERLGTLALPSLYRALRGARALADRARALHLIANVSRTPAYRPDARFALDHLTNGYLPRSGPQREPLRRRFVTTLTPEQQRTLAGDYEGTIAPLASFWHLPVLAGLFFSEPDPARQAVLEATIRRALARDARAALAERDDLAAWPDPDRFVDALADEKQAQVDRKWNRERFRYVDYGPLAHTWNVFANTQFGIWIGKILRFDFDTSIKYNRPVLQLIAERLPITLLLSFVSIILSYLIAIPLGVYSATNYHTTGDKVSTLLLFILYSLPTFWVGEMMILYLSNPQFLNVFPSHGLGNPDLTFSADGFEWLKNRAWHLVLPVVCYTYGSFAFLSRQMRSSMLETIRQDFIRTARAKGLSRNMVVYKHALRNSLIPILTLAANLLPALISGSVILETVFTIEGMGKLAVDAVFARDYAVINAIAVFSAALTLFGILLSDLSYALVDPRITYA